MEVKISLTKPQKRKLLKGHAVNLKHSQLMNGNVSVKLDNPHGKRLRRAMRANTGFRLQPSQVMVQEMIEGEGFKDVMRKVNKGVKKAITFTKNEVAPYAKEILAPAVKANRKHIDKALKGARERSEKQIEDVLTVNQCSNLQGHSRNLIPLECADAAKKCTCKLHSRLFLIRLKFENFQNKIVPGTEAHSKSKHKGPEAHSKSKHKGENHCAAFHHTRSSHKYGHSRCSEHY